MNQTSGKDHLTTLDILLELRCWLEDNVQMQVSQLQLSWLTCLTAINSPRPTASRPLMHCSTSYAISRAKKGQTQCDYLTPIPLRKRSRSCAIT